MWMGVSLGAPDRSAFDVGHHATATCAHRCRSPAQAQRRPKRTPPVATQAGPQRAGWNAESDVWCAGWQRTKQPACRTHSSRRHGCSRGVVHKTRLPSTFHLPPHLRLQAGGVKPVGAGLLAARTRGAPEEWDEGGIQEHKKSAEDHPTDVLASRWIGGTSARPPHAHAHTRTHGSLEQEHSVLWLEQVEREQLQPSRGGGRRRRRQVADGLSGRGSTLHTQQRGTPQHTQVDPITTPFNQTTCTTHLHPPGKTPWPRPPRPAQALARRPSRM